MKKDITIGYIELSGKSFISDIQNTNTLLKFLLFYVNVEIIPLNGKAEIEKQFSLIKRHKIDYLYVDSFNFFLESFILRERFGADIPFIFRIDTFAPWVREYIAAVPFLRKYDIIIAPSQYAKKMFSRLCGKHDIFLLPYLLDADAAEDVSFYASKKRKNVISFLGRLEEHKGVGFLIDCMPEIIKKVKTVNLDIIGPLSGRKIKDFPESDYVKKLRDRVKTLGMEDKVHFKGLRLGFDKYRILHESDVFVNPTLAKEETFGVVNIEAFMCGIPVVAADWAGNKELISDGKNGFLARTGRDGNGKTKIDEEHFISLIVKILKDRKLNAKMKKNAKKTALIYDYKKNLPGFIDFLKNNKKNSYKSRWASLKKKKVIDFRPLYTEDMFFFIAFDPIFRKKTYAQFYKDNLGSDNLMAERAAGKQDLEYKPSGLMEEKIGRAFNLVILGQLDIKDDRKSER